MIESEIIPFYSIEPIGERVLVLAPHPDDEVLGCGGTIKILLDKGKYVRVVFLTSGDKGEPDSILAREIVDSLKPHVTSYAIMREKEAKDTMDFLGIKEYEFLRFPDREIGINSENIYKEIYERVDIYDIDTIYCPSIIELNPDHRDTAKICINLINESKVSSRAKMNELGLLFYEVTTPLRPNILVDITRVASEKRKAIRNYRSQLRLNDYLEHIMALNRIRSLTVKGSRYVEAFWYIDKYLKERDLMGWISYQDKIVRPMINSDF